MADDYDFDDDFGDEEIDYGANKKAPAKPQTKPAPAANKKKDDFESFDMEEVKDELDDYAKSEKKLPSVKDVKHPVKEKAPEAKPSLMIPAKEDKGPNKKKNDDFEEIDSFDDDNGFGKKKENKPQQQQPKPQSLQKPELALPKNPAQLQKDAGSASKNKSGFDDLDDEDDDDNKPLNKKPDIKSNTKPQSGIKPDLALPKNPAPAQKESVSPDKKKNAFDDLDDEDEDEEFNKKLENKPSIKPQLKPQLKQPETVQASRPNPPVQTSNKKKEPSEDGSNYDEEFEREEEAQPRRQEFPPKKVEKPPASKRNDHDDDFNKKVKKEVDSFLDDMDKKIAAPTHKYESPESKPVVRPPVKQEPPVVRQEPKPEPKVVEKPVAASYQMRADMMSPQYQKLLEQNKKLKEELRGLAKAADEALQRERQHRSAKKNREEEPELKEKMQELRDQLAKIDQLKHHITIMKRQLKNTYNLPKVVEKEDELKAAQKELNKVVEEKNSLLKIKKEQNKALDFLNNEGEYEKKLKQVTQELRQVKEDYRRENELFQENDKAMKKLHEKIIVTEERCRELQKKIKDKKAEKPKSQGPTDIGKEDVSDLEMKVRELQERKNIIEKGFEEETRALEKKKKALQNENGKLALMLKDKEKEIRLNNLRLKELRKLTRYNAVKPVAEAARDLSLNRGSSRGSELELRSKSNNPKKVPSKGSDKKAALKEVEEKPQLRNRVHEKKRSDSFDDDQEITYETPQKNKLEEKDHRGREAEPGSQRSHKANVKSGSKADEDDNLEEVEQIQDKFEDNDDKDSSREMPTNPFSKPNLKKKI